MKRRSTCILALVIALGLVTRAERALAQAGGNRNAALTDADQTEARERYSRGMQLVAEGNYQGALIEMQRAYTLNPSYKILYNLGQIYSHLNDYASAQTNFERYLSEGGADIPAGRLAEVNQELARLRPRVASVNLEVKGEGAEVLLDDAVIGRSPFHKTVLVNAGKHKFSTARPGAEPVTRVMPLAGEDKVTLELDVSTKATQGKTNPSAKNTNAPHAERQPAAPSASAQERPETPSYLWIGWTVTAALGLGTGIAGYIATTKAQDLKDLRASPGATRQGLDDSERATFRAALVTDVLLGATVLAGGVSLYFTLASGSKNPKDNAGQNVALAIQPTGVWLRSSF